MHQNYKTVQLYKLTSSVQSQYSPSFHPSTLPSILSHRLQGSSCWQLAEKIGKVLKTLQTVHVQIFMFLISIAGMCYLVFLYKLKKKQLVTKQHFLLLCNSMYFRFSYTKIISYALQKYDELFILVLWPLASLNN